jgi:hypothetical protein
MSTTERRQIIASLTETVARCARDLELRRRGLARLRATLRREQRKLTRTRP